MLRNIIFNEHRISELLNHRPKDPTMLGVAFGPPKLEKLSFNFNFSINDKITF